MTSTKKKSPKSKGTKRRRVIIPVLLIIFVTAALVIGGLTYKIWGPNTSVTNDEYYLYIPTGANFEQVKDSLVKNGILRNVSSFEWTAAKKGYKQNIKSGRYLVKSNMSNNSLVDMLRAGKQVPVKVVFNSIRLKDQFAGKIGKQLEVDSNRLLELLNDKKTAQKYGFDKENFLCMFIPDTYEMYWNTSPEKFIDKMNRQYHNFWNTERRKQAELIGLKPDEVIILASIVEQETIKEDEKPTVAGVYMNRINKGMPLEADPTLKYAIGDFAIQRILNKDKLINSPYNTYMYTGLPPGPICMPSVSSVKSVLKYNHHNYIFFCAKDDLSGYHNFARTLDQHMRNARAYQNGLNKINIRR